MNERAKRKTKRLTTTHKVVETKREEVLTAGKLTASYNQYAEEHSQASPAGCAPRPSLDKALSLILQRLHVILGLNAVAIIYLYEVLMKMHFPPWFLLLS